MGQLPKTVANVKAKIAALEKELIVLRAHLVVLGRVRKKIGQNKHILERNAAREGWQKGSHIDSLPKQPLISRNENPPSLKDSD